MGISTVVSPSLHADDDADDDGSHADDDSNHADHIDR